MRRFVLVVLCALLTTAGTASDVRGEEEVEAFRGRLFLRDGNSAEFLYLGEEGEVYQHLVRGDLLGHAVKYDLADLRSVVFAEPQKSYTEKEPGDLVIENQEGKRFTLRHATFGYVYGSTFYDGRFAYVFADPVTNSPKAARIHGLRKLSHVEVGRAKGVVKVNARSQQYYPAMYEYDPFTGERLVWARERPVEPQEVPR